jgi:hypothetical protein
MVIDERRFVLGPLDAPSAAVIVADYRAGALASIVPGGTLEYYEEFNASGRADVDAQSKSSPFVIVTMDGQLKVSDGTRAERVINSANDASREVPIHAPVVWKSIPSGALVIVDKP